MGRGGSDLTASTNVDVLITAVTTVVSVHLDIPVRKDGLAQHVSTVGLKVSFIIIIHRSFFFVVFVPLKGFLS